MTKNISGHAPGHLREEVLELIEDEELISDKEKTKRFYDLLGELWNCTDIMPSDAINTINNIYDLLPPDEELPLGCTYGMCARKIYPILKEMI